VQIHHGDAYATAWGNSRATFYTLEYYPTSWFDGVIPRVGAYSYSTYLADYNARRAVATDVVMQLGARQLSGQTYEVSAKVEIEPGGTTKTMRIYIVQVLDYWPASPTYHRNGFKQAAATQDVTLSAGQSQVVTRTMTFDSGSWSQQSNIRLIGWAQRITGGKDVYQAAVMPWPFTPLGPPPGDMDGSQAIDLDDIDDFVLALVDPAAYATAHPTLDPVEIGDLNADGLLDGNDIYPFMVLVIEALGGDISPPTPNPMTFAASPAPYWETPEIAINMSATPASDPTTPIHYAFEANTGPAYPGADGRDWSTARAHNDTGLTPNTTYGYRVRARDGCSTPNVTEWSSVAYATTYARPPGQPALGNATYTTMTIDVALDDGTTPYNPDYTALAIQCTSTTHGAWNGQWVDAYGNASAAPVWQTDAQWAVSVIQGLQSSTSYTFAVKAQNLASIETDFGPWATLSTLTP
jgi:hypothetical protein